ncbi:serine/threonine-protein kinase [Mycolicibacterium holsaticum]|uniref:non-specific serine/threonine protein kinase n=1 Tax=Mycolicibacterium holsaticum TaxID=152142 RepID=A0A1E3RFH3_9MYCO|nr:protein kinase [Mycolicibacterium holsaticum]
MPLTAGTKFAGYTIQRMLGSGGMGEVYLARHPRLPRQDAIKVLRSDISADPDFMQRFNREADLAAKLWHPHIVGIHDRGRFRGRLWISMDFVDGPDVGRLIREQFPNGMPAQDVIEIVTAVAGALDYAHAQGLLHRDVKPANIMVSDIESGERRILLGDFGVARDLADDSSGLTATNMTVGTAVYAAPEQLMGLALDGRTDQYSLAVTAYQMLTGGPPFRHSNPAVVIGQHLNAPVPALADTHSQLAPFDGVISRALAKDPHGRFPTCTDFARALERLHDSGIRVAPAPGLNVAETMPRPVASSAPADIPGQDEHTAGPGRKDRGRVVPLVLAAAAAAVLIVAIVGYFAVASTTNEAEPELFTLAGILRLPDDAAKTTDLPEGYMCAGTRDYGDIGPNTPVTVEDESGTLLAKGAIQGSNRGPDACLLRFRVDEVPTGARFYRIQVAQQPEVSYTEAEAKAGVDVALGRSVPGEAPTTATPSATKAPSKTSTQTVTVTPDVEMSSLNQLRALANRDRSDVAAYLTDVWVPQISSKRVGLEAEGTVWNNGKILDEHLRLRDQYPDVKLLWSGDWSTFDGRNFWVTIVGLKSPYYDDVLSWCRDQGFDRNHCLAKMVSTWRPVEGTTRLMN